MTRFWRDLGESFLESVDLEVDGDEPVTDPPSAPGIEPTRFRVTRDGLLVLERDGESSRCGAAWAGAR